MADSTTRNNEETNRNETTGQQQSGINSVIRHMVTKRTETFLLTIRLATLIFTLLYLIPFTSFSSANLYQKALLANAAISALRLHQRLPPFRFSREYLALLMFEDSAHYLFYSLIFISNYPITLVLLPLCLFAFLHSCSALLNVLNVSGINNKFKELLDKIVHNQRQILLTIALTEITLMPAIVFAIMAGVASIFTPLMYYQFLALRYASHRNPYNRQAFHWLRISFQNYAFSPSCPQFLRTTIYKGIELVCRLAPQMAPS